VYPTEIFEEAQMLASEPTALGHSFELLGESLGDQVVIQKVLVRSHGVLRMDDLIKFLTRCSAIRPIHTTDMPAR
jgi:hypothetical protein